MRPVGFILLIGAGCGRLGFELPRTGDGNDTVDAKVGSARDGSVVDAPPALSCVGLPAICGPSGASSCCDSPLVTGGTFFRGYDVAADGSFPDMTNPATLSDFRLDTYEVTVGRFRQFVNAAIGTQQNPPSAGAGARMLNGTANQGGWDAIWNPSLVTDTAAMIAAVKCSATDQTWTDAPAGNENLAMNCITWYEAMAFCAWDGGFLPTLAEWNYAATGGGEQRAYPWSNPPSSVTIDCSYANFYNVTDACIDPPNGGVGPVGAESPKGDGKWGQADLAGNVAEWVLDYNAVDANPCDDCATLKPSAYRDTASSVFNGFPGTLRVAIGSVDVPSGRTYNLGVRCARAP